MGDPLFSIVILALSRRHLLPLTLDTIKSQSEKQFEVLLIGSESLYLREMASSYPGMSIRICHSEGTESSEMMNAAIRESLGKYLQFLYPGDRFISQYGLSYLRELICDSAEPHLVYSGFLMRGPVQPPQAVAFPLNRETLQKGMFSTLSRSAWFLKDSLTELGGFDRYLQHRFAFDFICRLFQKQGLRVVYSRRVLTDCEPHRTSPREMAEYASETCRILYRHFGLWHALRWMFVQDHLKILSWVARLVKQAFWKSDL